jgi:hypothetical protein
LSRFIFFFFSVSAIFGWLAGRCFILHFLLVYHCQLLRSHSQTWDEIVRNIEGIKPGDKTGPLDEYQLPWEKFVVEYP